MRLARTLMALALTAGAASLANAAVTVVVDDVAGNNAAYVNGTGGNFTGATALKDAVAAIKADPTSTTFTINIVDSNGVADVYDGPVVVETTGTTVQQLPNGNGNDVAIEVAPNAAGAYVLGTTVPNVSFIGLSATKQLVVRIGTPNIGTGTQNNANNILFKNITYVGSGALDHNDFGVLAPKTVTFDHCTFKVGNGPQTFTNVTYNDCNFLGGGFKIVVLGGNLIANRCVITSGAGGFHLGGDAGKTITFNDCQMNTGNARMFGPLAANLTVTFNRPVFTGRSGDIMWPMGANNMTLNVNGTPTNKVDFDLATGIALYARVLSGKINLTDCKGSVRPGAGSFDCADGATPLNGNVAITMTRCEWKNGTGDFIAADGGAGAFKVDFTATNTIWSGTTPAGHIASIGGGHTGTGAITLNHCTATIGTVNAYFFGDPGDVVILDGCIINPSKISASHLLSSIPYQTKTPHIPNITYANVADDGTGSPFVGNPMNATAKTPAQTGDLVVNPMVDATGHLLANSPAIGHAVNSTIADDVDGDTRPLGLAGTRDIGADETAAVPVELGTFSIE